MGVSKFAYSCGDYDCCCTCSCVAGGGSSTGVADAERVVGQANSPHTAQTAGTNNLSITLSPGNPEEPGGRAAGRVDGITIKLSRLKGVDPRNVADMAKISRASVEQIKELDTDRDECAVTDSNGHVRLSGLSEGIYLVTAQTPAGARPGDYRQVREFLVSIPFHSLPFTSSPVEGVIVAKTAEPDSPTPPTPVPSPGEPPNGSTTPSLPFDPQHPRPGHPVPGSPTTGTSFSSEPTSPPPAEKDRGRQQQGLAMTGVQIIGLVIAAVLLLGSGVLLMWMSHRKSNRGGGQ